MLRIAEELEIFIEQHVDNLYAVPANTMLLKPSPTKWSKKEIVGHLIDSAQNNLRRFIVGQYEEQPHIVYNQDKWVAISNYQDDSQHLHDIINLWYLLNKHMAVVLKNTSAAIGQRTVLASKVHTIEWLAVDYIKHLRHHIHQVLELEPVAYP